MTEEGMEDVDDVFEWMDAVGYETRGLLREHVPLDDPDLIVVDEPDHEMATVVEVYDMGHSGMEEDRFDPVALVQVLSGVSSETDRMYTMPAVDVPSFTEFVESGWEVTVKTENGEKFLG